jgi:hypothetical protein
MAGCRQTPVSAPGSDLATVTPTDATPIQEPTPTQKAAPIQTLEMSKEIQPDILDIPYTEDNPLTDADEIIKILEMLVQKHIEWLSRPGWYLYWEHIQGESIAEQYAESIDEQYVRGVHFINEHGECDEQFFFIIRGGQILPSQIQLKDGTMAWLYDQREPSIMPVEEGRSCEMGDAGNVYELLYESEVITRFLGETQSSELETYKLHLWEEVVNGRKMVVLQEDVMPLKPGIYRQQDGTWVPTGRHIDRTYFDLLSGGIVGHQGTLYTADGELLYGGQDDGWEPPLLLFLDQLPTEVAQVYKESTAAVTEYIQRQEE